MSDENQTHHQLLNEGQQALQRGAYRRAFDCFETVYQASPGNMTAAVGVALAIGFSGDVEQGIKLLNSLSENNPPHAQVHDGLGMLQLNAHRFDEAEKQFRKAIRLGGSQTALICNLGMALNELGRFDESASMFKRCLRQNKADVSARYHLGLCQLLSGDYVNGWEGFALRNQVAGRGAPSVSEAIPRWQGEPLGDCSIVLLSEQGLGDTIQFARFAAPLAEMGARVFLRCHAALKDVLLTIEGIQDVLAPGDELPELDYQVPLLDVPGILAVTAETIILSGGYISVPESGITAPALKEAGQDNLKVGLVWAGNPDNKTDYKRSLPVAELRNLLDLPGVTFFSLQAGPAQQQLADMPEALRPVDLLDPPKSLGDVASDLAELDLLITVDTALAHLAGAMGVPVWTLVSLVPDWRWQLQRDDTPWYQSMRLFRQPAIGDWQQVVVDLRSALTSFR